MTSCLLQSLLTGSERSRTVGTAEQFLKQSSDIRQEVTDQRRNLWLAARWRALAPRLKSNGGSWFKNLTDALLQAFRVPEALRIAAELGASSSPSRFHKRDRSMDAESAASISAIPNVQEVLLAYMKAADLPQWPGQRIVSLQIVRFDREIRMYCIRGQAPRSWPRPVGGPLSSYCI
jgi:hypothetical protein